MPESIADLAEMSGYEFQRWALSLMRATPSPRLSGDKGIDGKMLVTNDPIQVKQKQAFDAKELLKASPTKRIVQESRKRGQQLSLDEFVPRAPKSRPKVDDLVANEMRARAAREHVEAP